MADTSPLVSVIIPTYNRKESLLRTLDSLARQTYPADRMEVIVVDDGSTDGTAELAWPAYPFRCVYLAQANLGEIPARNAGVSCSYGDVLVFLDDDIEVVPRYIQALCDVHSVHENAIVLGVLAEPAEMLPPIGNRVTQVSEIDSASGVLSISRRGYLDVGGMRSLGMPGRNTWGGIDFAHRAVKHGYTVWRAEEALAVHHDDSSRDLASRCARAEKVSRAVQHLFREHPDLKGRIPMFVDKGPIHWGHDSAILISRKVLRSLVSSGPAQAVVRGLTRLLERYHPDSGLLGHLRNWQVSAHIRRGYREGLRELARDV